MYEQTLYSVIEPIKINTIKRLNKAKKWKYGYNKENDVVVISKTGQIRCSHHLGIPGIGARLNLRFTPKMFGV